MWKQISKINFYRFFNFCIDNSSVFPEITFRSNLKKIIEYSSCYYFVEVYDPLYIPVFRKVEYINGRVTYFVSIPFVEWFKKYIN